MISPVIIGIAVLLVVGIGAFLWYRKKNEEEAKKATPTPGTSSTSTTTEPAVPGSTGTGTGATGATGTGTQTSTSTNLTPTETATTTGGTTSTTGTATSATNNATPTGTATTTATGTATTTGTTTTATTAPPPNLNIDLGTVTTTITPNTTTVEATTISNGSTVGGAPTLRGDGFGSGLMISAPRTIRLTLQLYQGVPANDRMGSGYNGLYVITPKALTSEAVAAMQLFRQGAMVRMHSLTSAGQPLPFNVLSSLRATTSWTLTPGYIYNIVQFNNRFDLSGNGRFPAGPVELSFDIYQ